MLLLSRTEVGHLGSQGGDSLGISALSGQSTSPPWACPAPGDGCPALAVQGALPGLLLDTHQKLHKLTAKPQVKAAGELHAKVRMPERVR